MSSSSSTFEEPKSNVILDVADAISKITNHTEHKNTNDVNSSEESNKIHKNNTGSMQQSRILKRNCIDAIKLLDSINKHNCRLTTFW